MVIVMVVKMIRFIKPWQAGFFPGCLSVTSNGSLTLLIEQHKFMLLQLLKIAYFLFIVGVLVVVVVVVAVIYCRFICMQNEMYVYM